MDELKGKRICILAGQGFEDMELLYPLFRLKYEAGADVRIIGMKKGETLYGKNGMSVSVDDAITDVSPDDFDALVIPGGYSPDHLRIHDEPVSFIRNFDRAGKPIAAICHGPQLLITARLLKDMDATCWPSLVVDLENAGARFHDQPLVTSRQYIFSRMPADCGHFCNAIINALATKGGMEAAQAARAM